MLKKFVAVAAVVSALGLVSTPAFAAGPQLCYTAHVDINGTVQDQAGCLPG
jgi:type 1 fimbria pilin